MPQSNSGPELILSSSPEATPVWLHRRFTAGSVLISLVFLAWSAGFIWRASFTAIDGHRYFGLSDDALISMRYGWNLSHGVGLVWNEGERVEGYTSLLMTSVMSLATGALNKRLAPLAIQAFGVACLLTIGFLNARLALEIPPRAHGPLQRLRALLGLLFGLSYYPLAYWGLSGMETSLLTVLLFFSLLMAVRSGALASRFGAALTGLGLGLAVLTRPDALIPAAMILMVLGRMLPRPHRLRELSLAVMLLLTFPLIQLAFRLGYYGEWLPNTYVLKLTGVPLAIRLASGIGFVMPFLRETWTLWALGILGWLTLRSRQTSGYLWIPIGLLVYQIWVGGDPWNYWRILAPGIPLLLNLAWLPIERFLVWAERWLEQYDPWLALRSSLPPSRQLPAAILLASFFCLVIALFADQLRISDAGLGNEQWLLLWVGVGGGLLAIIAFVDPGLRLRWILPGLVLLLPGNARFARQIAFLDRPFSSVENEYQVNLALGIVELTHPQASVGVIWAGGIPYYTGLYAIDFLGKSDPYIASLPPDLTRPHWMGMLTVPGHNKYDLGYSIQSRLPTYVQAFKWGSQDIREWGRMHYASINYHGVVLDLLLNSTDVRWDRIQTLESSPAFESEP